jgi:hypothetical protein
MAQAGAVDHAHIAACPTRAKPVIMVMSGRLARSEEGR